MKNNILLQGSGNLGKRYIEAICKNDSYYLTVYDPNQSAIESSHIFMKQKGLSLLQTNFTSNYQEALSVISKNTLVIDASTANGRVKRLMNILELKPKSLIIEKPIAQNHQELEMLLEKLKENPIPTFVNFTLRMQPMYHILKEKIKNSGDAVFIANLPKYGLLCVGIHYIDLFMYLFDLQNIRSIGHTYKGNYEQKRKGFYDVIGSISLESNECSAYINNSANDNMRVIQVITQNATYAVYEDNRLMTTIEKDNNTIKIDNLIYEFVSSYMSDIISKIFADKLYDINLPDINESVDQHKVLFDYLAFFEIHNLNFT